MLSQTHTETTVWQQRFLPHKVCAVDATVTAIPAYIKTDTIALSWVGCFGSAPYSYTNAGTTIQTQLQRIVAVLNAKVGYATKRS